MSNDKPAKEIIDLTDEVQSKDYWASSRKTIDWRKDRLEGRQHPAAGTSGRPTVNAKSAPPTAAQIAQAKEDLALIESVLGEALSPVAPTEDTFSLPLGTVLDLLPAEYVSARAPANEAGRMVRITMTDLFEQLRRGKMSIALKQLVLDVPPGFVTQAVFDDLSTHVDLPLAKVVASIDPALLKKRTARESHSATVDALPDPFERRLRPPSPPAPPVITPTIAATAAPFAPVVRPPPAVPPAPGVSVVAPLAAQAPIATPPATPVATPAPVEPSPRAAPPVFVPPVVIQPVAVAPVAPPAVVAPPVPPPPEPATPPAVAALPLTPAAPAEPRDDFVEPAGVDRLGGVNLNAATVAQLMTLSGVSPALAERIVEYRAQHGPFKSIFAIKDVARVGRKTFYKITGMPYSETHHHRSERLARLLELAQRDVYHLPRIAEKLAAQPGFTGCVISDKDGMMLAQFGADAYAESFSAVAPRMLGQLSANMSEIELGTVRSVSIAAGNLMFTVLQSGGIYISAVHERRKLTKSQFELAEKVAREVDWLLSHRGYIGR